MIKIERTLTIHRPLEQVFAYLSDVAHGATYISGEREAHTTSPGPMAVGTTFTTRSFLRRSRTYQVTEYEPSRALSWRTTSGTPESTTWVFEPSGPSTRVTFKRTTDLPGLFRLAEPVLKQRASGQVDSDLAHLKELLAITRTAETEAKRW